LQENRNKDYVGDCLKNMPKCESFFCMLRLPSNITCIHSLPSINYTIMQFISQFTFEFCCGSFYKVFTAYLLIILC